jgi:mRNA interferase MazF
MTPERGSVVLVELEAAREGEPRVAVLCVLLSDREVIGDPRFPLVCVAPISGRAGEGLLYPALAAGPSGLTKESFVLIDQLRTVDKRRIWRVFGVLGREEMRAVEEGLGAFLGMGR